MRGRRVRAAAAAAAYVLTFVALPLLHVASHARLLPHSHDAARIDWRAVRSADGRVDLGKLAAQLGLRETGAHTHPDGTRHAPHEEAPSDDEKTHGAGSFAHFAAALLAGGVVAVVPSRPAPSHLSPPALRDRVSAAKSGHYTVQRAQAPPAIRAGA